MGISLSRIGKAAATGGLSEAYGAGKSALKGDAGGVLDHTIGASGAYGIGAGGAELGKAGIQGLKDLYGGVSTAAMGQDRQRMIDMYNEREKERSTLHPEVRAQEASAPGDVVYHDPGAVERYSAALADGPQDVHVGQLNPVERVQSRDVQAAQAGYDPVSGAKIDTSQAQQARGLQDKYLATLQDRANGVGPSVAESSYMGKLADVQRSALGAAATARGSDRGYARLHAIDTVADQSRRAAMDAGQLRAQEASSALGALGSGLSDVRGADISQATTQAQLNQQAALQGQNVGADVSKFNAGLTTNTAETNAARDLAAQGTNAAAGNARTMDEAKMRADIDAGNVARTQQNAQFNAGEQTAANAGNTGAANARTTDTAAKQLVAATTNQGVTAANNQFNAGQRQSAETQTIQAGQNQQQISGGQAQAAASGAATVSNNAAAIAAGNKDRIAATVDAGIGAFGAGGAAALTASDVRVKENIREVPDASADRLAKALKVYEYNYKGDDAPRVGVMAQDLERDPVGKKLVREDRNGIKGVDYQGLTSLLLAAAARNRKEART